jgi:hypothetical protein
VGEPGVRARARRAEETAVIVAKFVPGEPNSLAIVFFVVFVVIAL